MGLCVAKRIGGISARNGLVIVERDCHRQPRKFSEVKRDQDNRRQRRYRRSGARWVRFRTAEPQSRAPDHYCKRRSQRSRRS
jgi:hypothetical protein